MAEPRLFPLARRWLLWSEWRAYPGRVTAALLAIALGVALGFAVHLINASALGEFDKAVRSVSGAADLTVRSKNAFGFDEALYPRVAGMHGVTVLPVVTAAATLDGKTQVALEGIDVFRAASVGQGTAMGGSSGFEGFLEGRSIYLSASALAVSGRKVGESTVVEANGHAFRADIAGTLPAAAGSRSAAMDIAAVQWRFGMLGRLQRMDIRVGRDADVAKTKRAIAAALPADAIVVDAAAEASQNDSLSAAYRVNLDMLALVALLTGGFLVYSAQSLSVARRNAQFALLRVLGMEAGKVRAQVLTEAILLGVVGAGAGIALGLALASLALKLLGGDLGGGYFRGGTPQLVFVPWAAVTFALLGVAAAVFGSMVPALAAARAAPGIAIKNPGDVVDPRVRVRPWMAVAFLACAAFASVLPAVRGVAVFGYVAMALLIASGVALMPWLARVLVSPLRRLSPRAVPFRLAIARLWGAPSQASVALAGMLAATALTVAMAVMVSSFRESVDRWLGDVLRADIYIQANDTASGGFAAATQARMRAVPGVAWMGVLKETPLRFDERRPPVALLARTLDGPGAQHSLLGPEAPVPPDAVAAWISEPASRVYGWKPGDRLTLPLPGAPRVTVAGVWRDYARQHGAIVVDERAYARWTGDTMRTAVSVVVAPGADNDSVVAGLRAAAGRDGIEYTVSRPQEIRGKALEAFDRSFLITYLLEGIAVCVGLAGVAATVGAQVLARIREFGMLRHVGATRGELARMLLIEGALLGGVGGIAGVGLGLVMSQVLIHVVNPQSFHWTMDTVFPWPVLGGVVATLIVATAGVALAVGRSVLSTDAVRAVREDW